MIFLINYWFICRYVFSDETWYIRIPEFKNIYFLIIFDVLFNLKFMSLKNENITIRKLRCLNNGIYEKLEKEKHPNLWL